MYLVKTPEFIQHLFPNFTWRIPSLDKVLHFTFDYGPIPVLTPWVLEQLKAYNARATFFCVGDNIRKHSQVFQQITEYGHAVGNHTLNHLNGWVSDNLPYFHNVRHCAKLVNSVLYRPPYGRMKPKQAQFLQRHYRIVMWDVLSGDFDAALTPQQCFENVKNNARPGSIVVFHDSLKAEERLTYALPRALQYFCERGFRFEALDEHGLIQSKPAKNIA